MIPLSGTWKLGEFAEGGGVAAGAHLAEYDDSAWLNAEVPGDVHTALLKTGLIADPFVAQNVEACGWVERAEWWYRAAFDAPALADGESAALVLEGLDTFATVYVNGAEMGSTANALMPHRIDVTSALQPGANVVAVRFDSTVATVEKKDSSPFWAAFYSPRVWVRKAAMNFGWDWGPRLVTCGVWRPVGLEVCGGVRIESHYARTHAVTPEHAVVLVGAEIAVAEGVSPPVRLRATLTHAGRKITADAAFGGNAAEARLLVKDPLLWWPSGVGASPVHALTVEVIGADGTVLSKAEDRIGIRTVQLLQTPDPDGKGKTFTFAVNGVKVFAKGADWIPADNFIGSVPAERYRALVRLAADGNMNMLRVWGGGVYEDDSFYRACDELGIMVWQDFMFGCAAYPDYDDEFMENVRAEARAVVKRLRNHPCVVVWCGNNENDWIDDMMDRGDPPKPFYGRRIYHESLPAACAELDPTRPYWPSSPYGGSDHNSEREGDRHNWQVWGGQVYPHRFGEPSRGDVASSNVSFRRYAEDTARFVSEYGIHASPPLRTLLKRTGPLEYDSEEFLYRIKDPDTMRKIRMMEAHIGQPTSLEQYQVYSMLVQAEGLRFAIEHYRRRMFDCSGSLLWQLNDCWPGISWSVIDYDLTPKAGWYYAKRAYAPVALSLKIEGDATSLYAVNDTLSAVSLEAVLITADTLDGVVAERHVRGIAAANSATMLGESSLDELGLTDASRRCVVIREANGLVPEHAVFPGELKDVRLRRAALNVEVARTNVGAEITVGSGVLAHFVGVDIDAERVVLDDNYVTLLPGETRVLKATARTRVTADAVTVDCLNNHRV